jgi:predicted NUDIX family phosphoesterase
MSKIAHILALKASTVPSDIGITTERLVIDRALGGEVWVAPRPYLETDPTFVQPIPYIVMRNRDKVLAYSRGGAGGEGRLHGKVSVGLGGHVDAADAQIDENGVILLYETLSEALRREVQEEIGLVLNDDQLGEVTNFTHIIQTCRTPVDSVHIGFVATLDFGQLAVSGVDLSFEDAISDAEWSTPADLLARHHAGTIELEPWSMLLLVILTIP